jgi:hypothetical protein
MEIEFEKTPTLSMKIKPISTPEGILCLDNLIIRYPI